MGGGWAWYWHRMGNNYRGGALHSRAWSGPLASDPYPATATIADGKQWALGAEGIKGVPETHRQEVSDLLTAQFNFFAAALGKTVFQRDTTRGSRRR